MKNSKVSVKVVKGDINKALKKFKNKTLDVGHLKELYERKTFIKPKTKRRLVKMNAIRENKRKLKDNILM